MLPPKTMVAIAVPILLAAIIALGAFLLYFIAKRRKRRNQREAEEAAAIKARIGEPHDAMTNVEPVPPPANTEIVTSSVSDSSTAVHNSTVQDSSTIRTRTIPAPAVDHQSVVTTTSGKESAPRPAVAPPVVMRNPPSYAEATSEVSGGKWSKRWKELKRKWPWHRRTIIS